MAHFLAETELNLALERLFEEANHDLILISPYIRLHERLRDKLKPKLNNPDLCVQILFGKNEEQPEKSFHKEDLLFLMKFAHVEIRYEPRLHAKYYANENQSILSSMNLFDYSINNNIEVGIRTKGISALRKLAGESDMDFQAYQYFKQVMDNARLLYQREPVYEKSKTILFSRSAYKGSEEKLNELASIFGREFQPSKPKEDLSRTKNTSSEQTQGYCIRTGVPIPFDPLRPLCREAYYEWRQYENPDYPEKYCHATGNRSRGKTSFRKPILEG